MKPPSLRERSSRHGSGLTLPERRRRIHDVLCLEILYVSFAVHFGEFFSCLTSAAWAEDWPEWRGKERLGVWNETGIVEKFPADGLKVEWRTPIRGGYSGPSVAAGRVYVTDFLPKEKKSGTERALCLDEKSGKVLWAHEWEADYAGVSYEVGPRATPTVDGDRVFVLGARGILEMSRHEYRR